MGPNWGEPVKLKKHVYRPGDRVWVIKPDMFVRCGYPLTFTALIEEFENHPKIEEAMKLFFEDGERVGWRERREFVWGLAKTAVRYRDFGGKERKIFTITDLRLEDKIVMVQSKFVVKTGTWEHVDEYQNALINQKTHIILRTTQGIIEAKNVVPANYKAFCRTKDGEAVFKKMQLSLPENLQGIHNEIQA